MRLKVCTLMRFFHGLIKNYEKIGFSEVMHRLFFVFFYFSLEGERVRALLCMGHVVVIKKG